MSFFQKGRPYVIAGPCSAETREQVLETARRLSDGAVHLFRAGVWKPRTRPGSFEGNGAAALEWLTEVKQQFNLPSIIEVAEPEHIELALKHGIDAVWIGARTTVNPFHIQRLADALNGTKLPVLVKNPVNPDVDLWLGAIERFEKAGAVDVGAIHRGFSGYGGENRNQPNWPIPIELKRRRPDLCLICDPSHITGNREKVASMAQKAMDMHFDGLMIETHITPEKAWTDAAQQVTPETLHLILSQLVIKQELGEDTNARVQLEYFRQLMDNLDAEIIDLIAKRLDLSNKIGEIKKDCNMTVYQPNRWREIVETITGRADQQGLSADFIVSIYEKIHHESVRRQLNIMGTTAENQTTH